MNRQADMLTLYDLCVTGTAPASVVAQGPGLPVSRATFQSEVLALAAHVRAAGGDTWAVSFDDPYHFAVALFAVLHAGATPLLLPHAQPELLAQMREQAAGLLTDTGVTVDGLTVIGIVQQHEMPAGHQPVRAMCLDPEREILLWTSGSTGAPALIRKPLRCLNAEVHTLQLLFGADGASASIAGSVGHQHIYGLLFRILWPLMSGRSIWRPLVRFPEDLTQLPAGAFFISSPAFLKRATPSLGAGGRTIPCPRTFSSGGPLPDGLAPALRTVADGGVFEIYGSTETGGIAWRQVTAAGPAEPWLPMPNIDVRTTDDRLEVRSPHLPEDDWFITSDLVTIMTDGRFTLGGRTDRIVKIEEKRISLTEVEQRLAAHDWVAECRVLVISGRERTGLGAVIVPTEAGWRQLAQAGKQAFRNVLRSYLAEAIEGVTLPRWWRFVRGLPRNTEGKTSETALAALFAPVPHTEPRVIETLRDEDSVSLRLAIDADIFYFRGHFPETPVLPGVAQLDWAINFGCDLFGLDKRRVRRIETLKFQKIIEPDREVTLLLTYKPAKSSFSFSYASGDDRHSSGRVVLGEDQ